METTRLSSVITGCGGKDTTCSRRSRRGSSRSTNGIRMVRPGFSVRWYLPSRSTTPARACGTIRTERTRTIITNATSTSSTIATAISIHHLFPSYVVLLCAAAVLPQILKPVAAAGRLCPGFRTRAGCLLGCRVRLRDNHGGGAVDRADDGVLPGGELAHLHAGTPDIAANFDQSAGGADGFHHQGRFADEAFDVAALVSRAAA